MSCFTHFLHVCRGAEVTAEVIGLSLLYGIPFAAVFGTLQHETRGVITAFIEFWRSSPIVALLFGYMQRYFPAQHVRCGTTLPVQSIRGKTALVVGAGAARRSRAAHLTSTV